MTSEESNTSVLTRGDNPEWRITVCDNKKRRIATAVLRHLYRRDGGGVGTVERRIMDEK